MDGRCRCNKNTSRCTRNEKRLIDAEPMTSVKHLEIECATRGQLQPNDSLVVKHDRSCRRLYVENSDTVVIFRSGTELYQKIF